MCRRLHAGRGPVQPLVPAMMGESSHWRAGQPHSSCITASRFGWGPCRANSLEISHTSPAPFTPLHRPSNHPVFPIRPLTGSSFHNPSPSLPAPQVNVVAPADYSLATPSPALPSFLRRERRRWRYGRATVMDSTLNSSGDYWQSLWTALP